MTELSRVAAHLTAHINYIGSSQTKRVLSTLNIQAVARQLKKEYHSKADIHEITAALEELYKLFEQGGVSGEVVKAHVDSIVDKIINKSVYVKPDISDYAKEILRELQSVKIKLYIIINGPHTRAVFLCYKLSADRICELKSFNPFTCDEVSASDKDFVFINLNYNAVAGFIVNNFC